MKIRSHLALVILVTLLPVLVFAGAILVHFDRQTREGNEQRLVETARALSVAVDQQIKIAEALLQSLGSSRHLQDLSLREFDPAAPALLATQRTWDAISLYDASGRRIFDTRPRRATPAPDRKNVETIRFVARTGVPLVAAAPGDQPGLPRIVAAVPVVRDETVAYVLSATLTSKALSDVLARQPLGDDTVCLLLDGRGVAVAASRGGQPLLAAPGLATDLPARLGTSGDGVAATIGAKGRSVYRAFSRSPVTEWTVVLSVPRVVVDAQLRSSLGLLLALAGAAALLGVLAAAYGARRIVVRVATLTSAAAALAAGRRVAVAPSNLMEVNEVVQALEQAGEDLRRHEAATLALASVGRELNERLELGHVTNQIVSAVLGLFHAHRVALYQVEPDGNGLVCVATAGALDPAKWLGQRLPRSAGVSGLALAEARLVTSTNANGNPALTVPEWMREALRNEPPGVVTAVPLRGRGEMLGVLSLGYEAGNVLADSESRLLSAFADQAAVALAHARLFEEAERRRRSAEALGEVGHLLSQSLDPHEVEQRIVDNSRALLGAGAAVLYRLDAETDELIPLAVSGGPAAGGSANAILPAGVARQAVQARHGFVSADVLSDPQVFLPLELRAKTEASDCRSTLAVPLMAQGRVIGALSVGDRMGRTFAIDDIRTARALADQAAVAMVNARLHAEMRERLTQSETMLAVSHQLSGALDVAETMRLVARETARAIGADMVGAFLADPTHSFFRPIAGYHVPKHLLQDFMTHAIPLKGHRALEDAWDTQHAVFSTNTALDPRVDQAVLARFPHRSSIFCPMIVQGEPIGGLFVAWFEQEQTPTPAELRLLEGIGRQAGVAIANTRLVEELKTRQGRLESMLAINAELSRIQPVDSLLVRIAEACGRMLDATSVLFRLVADDELVPHCQWGEATESMASASLKVGEGLAGTVAATGELLVIDDPASDPRVNPLTRESLRRSGVRAFLGVPIKVADQVAGVLTVRTHREEGFSPADVEMARILASQSAIALENSRLYQEIRSSFEQLTNTQKQLVQAQKMGAVGLLAAGVAHDFNNILTVVRGRSQLLLTRLAAGSPERRDIELIDQAAARAVGLTRQLLAVGRKQKLQPKPLDLNALVAGVAPMLRRLIGEHIELVLEPAGGIGQVMADAGQLEQVIINLVENARDAMGDGGSVTIATANRDLEAPLAHGPAEIPPGHYVTFSVADTGCGMDAATLVRIFEPTRLGLSTVHGIVHQSGGHIGIDSIVGRGTRFTIYLARTAAAIDVLGGPTAPALPKGRETVLVVEDDTEVLGLASDILRACGYSVLQSGDPAEAARLAERHRGTIDLLLTDMVMSELAGPALARRIASSHPETRILYMSGDIDASVVVREDGDPAGSFLQKPFTAELLARAVRSALDAIETVVA
jgi:GAF domain-containing protein